MTSLAAWIGVDARGPASLYLASDSRISFPNGGSPWDFGRKVFANATTPDIFGYCGDVQFPLTVLKQITAPPEDRSIVKPDDAAPVRHEKLTDFVQQAFSSYPEERVCGDCFTILHAAREGEGMAARYFLWRLDWQRLSGWQSELLTLPEKSALTLAVGSGNKIVGDFNKKWATALPRTSRSVFSSFCESLGSGRDPRSGGHPQLVGLYRRGAGLSFGVIYRARRYLFGAQVMNPAGYEHLEWRNELFERCDCHTMRILPGAQRQPSPFT